MFSWWTRCYLCFHSSSRIKERLQDRSLVALWRFPGQCFSSLSSSSMSFSSVFSLTTWSFLISYSSRLSETNLTFNAWLYPTNSVNWEDFTNTTLEKKWLPCWQSSSVGTMKLAITCGNCKCYVQAVIWMSRNREEVALILKNLLPFFRFSLSLTSLVRIFSSTFGYMPCRFLWPEILFLLGSLQTSTLGSMEDGWRRTSTIWDQQAA